MLELNVALMVEVAYRLINILFFFFFLVLVFPTFVAVCHFCALGGECMRLRSFHVELEMEDSCCSSNDVPMFCLRSGNRRD